MNQNNQKMPIAPQLYQEMLEQLELQSVCLDELQSCCDREAAQDGQVEIKLAINSEARQTEANYFAFITYSLRGERDKEMLLEIKAKYRLVFNASEPVPDGFFDVFRDLNLRITTMPYFRELVASMTGRMNIPTLTLPYDIYVAPAEEAKEQGNLLEDKAAPKRTRKPRVAKA